MTVPFFWFPIKIEFKGVENKISVPLKFSYATILRLDGNNISYKPKWGLLVEL